MKQNKNMKLLETVAVDSIYCLSQSETCRDKLFNFFVRVRIHCDTKTD